MNKVLVSIVVLAMLGAAVPTVDSQAGERAPQPLPLSTETNAFQILSMRNIVTEGDFGCKNALADWGLNTAGDRALYAINNVDDPCQVPANEATADRHAHTMGLDAKSWRVSVVPPMAAGTPLVEGEDIVVKFTLAVLGHNAFVDLAAGAVQPKVTLASGGTVIGTWDDAAPIGPDTLQPPQLGAYMVPFEARFPAPATLEAGLVNLTVDISNDLASQELRRVVTRVGFALSESSRGSITFPFATNVGDFGPPGDAGDNETGNETGPDDPTGNGTDAGNTTGNETVPDNTTAPTPTNTTAPSNNTTADAPDEQGFLPGFETAAVLGAALVALAFVARQRGRPLRPAQR